MLPCYYLLSSTDESLTTNRRYMKYNMSDKKLYIDTEYNQQTLKAELFFSQLKLYPFHNKRGKCVWYIGLNWCADLDFAIMQSFSS